MSLRHRRVPPRHHFAESAVAVALAASLAVAACSSSDTAGRADPAAAQGAASTTVAPSPPSTASGVDEGAGDLNAFCARFDELAAGRDPDDPSRLDLGDGSPEDVAAAYASQRDTVEDIAAAAPAEMADNAETYGDVIVARAEVAAATGANTVSEMDPGTRQAFIEDHAAQQAEINELLAYARDTCGDL